MDFLVRIDDVKVIATPGLVILVDNADATAKGSVDVNGNTYIFTGTWGNICRYNAFLADNDDLYIDVRTVNNIGLIASAVIPSFEMSLRRAPLYNALAELNFMYDVVFLSRLNDSSLAGYKAIVIRDVPWTGENQLRGIQKYNQAGGQVLTVGSSEELP